jgi:cytoskeletal protein RodZ
VTVGESLTKARHQAGLSVDELSERTRIRETVIRSIERDDYQACGGDLYVRGYVRAIAGAVGVDAQPLIREYDQGHETTELPATTELAATTEIRAFDADLDATRFDLTAFPGDTEATRFDLPAVRDGDLRPGEDLMAAGYDLPPTGSGEPARPAIPVQRGRVAYPGDAGAAGTQTRSRGRGLLAVFAAVVALAIVGTVGIRLASSSTTTRNTASTSVPKKVASSAAATKAAAKPTASGAASKKSATPAKSTGARPASGRLPVTSLPIAAAEAFGPDGLADGDNPENAHYAIAGDAPLPWSTQWYFTPEFGMLKHGTGLLLDLGRRVTVTSVRLDLSNYQGANLQLRIGDTTDPSGFNRVEATATDTGGVVRLTLHHQASARYLLVWFTLLPPDGAGHYAETVSSVLVNGRR